jgi:hypothetical protein
MEETLIQLSRVQDDGPTGCKLLLVGTKLPDLSGTDGTYRISTG